MVCAQPWKTCNCPWFNYQHLSDDDRLNDMRVPYAPGQNPIHSNQNQNQSHRDTRDIIEVTEFTSPVPPPPQVQQAPAPAPIRRSSTRLRRSGRERERERDRDLDRADEVLAQHLQTQLRVSGATPTPSEVRRDDPVAMYSLGNSGDHHMNDSYTLRPNPMPNTSVRTAARPTPAARGFFNRRLSVRETPRAVPVAVGGGKGQGGRARNVSAPAPTVAASAMAGLSKDGRKVGQNRVGTWLTHVMVDHEATHSAPRGVEVDDWRWEGSVAGID